jgi:sensor domain CHASE-containing protein
MKTSKVLVALLTLGASVVYSLMLWQHHAWLAAAAFLVSTSLSVINTQIQAA